MARTLYPYKEAKITPAMMIIGILMIIIMNVVIFIIMSVPSLA